MIKVSVWGWSGGSILRHPTRSSLAQGLGSVWIDVEEDGLIYVNKYESWPGIPQLEPRPIERVGCVLAVMKEVRDGG